MSLRQAVHADSPVRLRQKDYKERAVHWEPRRALRPYKHKSLVANIGPNHNIIIRNKPNLVGQSWGKKGLKHGA